VTSVGKIALFYRTTILGILNNIGIIANKL
jgi:hypothetical protein